MAISYKKLFDLMKLKNIKVTHLKSQYGFNNPVIEHLKTNNHVNTRTLEKLCKLLNCNIGDIVDYIPDDDT